MITRRDFIRNTAAAIALPVYIPIERLDKIYIPSKGVIKPSANRLLTPEATARVALAELRKQLRIGDIFTIEGYHSLNESIKVSEQLQQFIVVPGGDIRPFNLPNSPTY